MKSRARRRSGFTLIEVMVSLGVMMVGAVAVIGMQAHTIRGTAHARKMTTAMQIAQEWIERMKEDSHSWTTIATDAGSIAVALGGTTYLGHDTTSIAGQPDAFQTLPVVAPYTNAYDARGRPQTANGSQAFCVSYRRAWIWEGQLMRVDVRVWWPREVSRPGSPPTRPQFSQDGFGQCDDNLGLLDPGGPQYPWYHAVYLSTAIRANEVRR